MNDSAAGFASSLSASGYALLALAVLAYALYSVYVEKAVGYSGAEITFAMLAAGALVFGVNRTASFIGVSTVVSIAAGALLLGERLTAGQRHEQSGKDGILKSWCACWHTAIDMDGLPSSLRQAG